MKCLQLCQINSNLCRLYRKDIQYSYYLDDLERKVITEKGAQEACAQRFRYTLFAFIHTQTYFEYYTLTLRLASLVKKTVIYAYWTKELFDICRKNVS